MTRTDFLLYCSKHGIEHLSLVSTSMIAATYPSCQPVLKTLPVLELFCLYPDNLLLASRNVSDCLSIWFAGSCS